jgi:hypothetical protein
MSELSCVRSKMCTSKGIQLKYRLQHNGIWSASGWPLRRLSCYRPIVFFSHLPLIVILLTQGKIRRAFQKCSPPRPTRPPPFLRIACLKLRDLKFCKSGHVCVCTHSSRLISASYSMCTGFVSGWRGWGGENRRGVMLTPQLCLAPRVNIRGTITLFPVYAFMVWIWNSSLRFTCIVHFVGNLDV